MLNFDIVRSIYTKIRFIQFIQQWYQKYRHSMINNSKVKTAFVIWIWNVHSQSDNHSNPNKSIRAKKKMRKNSNGIEAKRRQPMFLNDYYGKCGLFWVYILMGIIYSNSIGFFEVNFLVQRSNCKRHDNFHRLYESCEFHRKNKMREYRFKTVTRITRRYFSNFIRTNCII